MSQEYTVFKKFTAQDYATVPFNANKQYQFKSSGSVNSNGIKSFNAKWTSESISQFSTASLFYGHDLFNNKIYNQINHLYYKNYKRDILDRFQELNYKTDRRELYERVNVLSIPAGHYGHSIKKGSFKVIDDTYNIAIVDDSKGNLIVSGTNLDNFNTDITSNVFRLGPIKGFEKYDLGVYSDNYIKINVTEEIPFYRKGQPIPGGGPSSYSTSPFGDEFDDSYYFNLIKYKNVNFKLRPLNTGGINYQHSCIEFNGESSEVKKANDETLNFNGSEDFTISFWTSVSQSASDTSYLISKSTTKTIVPSPTAQRTGIVNTLKTTGSAQSIDVNAGPKFPYEIYVETGPTLTNAKPYLYFSRSDGNIIRRVSASFTTGSELQHVTCRYDNSEMKIYLNGIAAGSVLTDNLNTTQNNANLYIGNKGGKSNFLTGSMSNINIYRDALTDTQILNHYSSSNSSPFIGNLFYSHGIATVTHPNYQHVLYGPGYDSFFAGGGTNKQKGIITKYPTVFNPLPGLRFEKSINIHDKEPKPTDLAFNNDGSKVYVTGTGGDNVEQFALSTSFDVLTATHEKGSTHGIISTGSENAPRGLEFNDDGTKLFVVGSDQDLIMEHNLSGAFDIGSVTNVSKSLSLVGDSIENSNPQGIRFMNNGKSFLSVSGTTRSFIQINLTGSFDIHATANADNLDIHTVPSQSITFANIDGIDIVTTGTAYSFGNSFDISPDEQQIILTDYKNDAIYYLQFKTPHDVSSLEVVKKLTVNETILSGSTTMNRGVRWELGPSPIRGGISGTIGPVVFKTPRLYIGAQDNSLQPKAVINQYSINGSNIEEINYQGNHLIYENEYQCTVDEHEFNDTLNISARKNQTNQDSELKDFITGSLFNPYVTTIGLYNEHQELLVVGKLGQPVRMSNETDTTFIVRWDT